MSKASANHAYNHVNNPDSVSLFGFPGIDVGY